MIPVMYSRDDVYRRLHGTAAIYKDKVYFVCGRDYSSQYLNTPPLDLDEVVLYPFVFRADEYTAYDPKTMPRVKYTDPALKIKGICGGYVNWNNSSNFLVRDPTRDSHLGIHPLNVTAHSATNNFSARHFYTPEVANAFLGIYPSYEESLEAIKGSSSMKGRAFNKEYGLVRLDQGLIKLEVRGVSVAINIGSNEAFIPLNKKTFSVIEEELLPYNIKIN